MKSYHRYTEKLDDKYGWNDPFILGRTLSQPDCWKPSVGREHREDSTNPVLHGK
jgi:hypothetical protein